MCNSDMVPLRAETVNVMLKSAGFIWWRLRDARQLPWSLVGGDVQDKLQQLKSGAKPMDRVGGKSWELMQLGIYDGVCLAGVRLLQEAPWGAAAVEEGHASTTMLLRKHTYGDNTLRTRAALAQARPLFSQTRLFKRINLARQRLHRLRCKQPHRIKGRHMLMRER